MARLHGGGFRYRAANLQTPQTPDSVLAQIGTPWGPSKDGRFMNFHYIKLYQMLGDHRMTADKHEQRWDIHTERQLPASKAGATAVTVLNSGSWLALLSQADKLSSDGIGLPIISLVCEVSLMSSKRGFKIKIC